MGERLQSRMMFICGITSVLVLTTASFAQAQNPGQGQIQIQGEFVPGEIIIKLKGKAKSVGAQAFIGKAVSEKAMTLKGSWSGLNLHHFSLAPGKSVEDSLAELQNDPDVEYAEPNFIVHRQSEGMEGNPISMDQARAEAVASGTVTTMNTTAQTGAPIQLGAAWTAMSTGKTPPVVAIIDTGMDMNHTVFTGSGVIWTNPGEIASNGIDDEKNGYVDDVHGWNFAYGTNDPSDDDGHGTHVSGIVLGATQDITANPIAAAQIRIMPLKFLDSSGSGTTSAAVQAIYYAVNNGAKVLSNSWGGGGFSNSLLDAINYAYSNGKIFVAAAGNASANNDSSPTYPANYTVPNMMSIAATYDSDGLASFSNYGAQTVHMGSPGVSIWSTYPNNQYARMSGTSMATPFVAGVAAMMVREQPTMNGYQIKHLIFNGADQVNGLVGKTTTQARLDAANAVVSAKSATVDPSLPAYDISAARAPASAASTSPSLGGCGLVAAINGSDGDGGSLTGANKHVMFFAILLAMISPILLSLALRSRGGKNQRRYTRYQIDSQVRVRFGDKELVGNVSTISLGGVQLNTDAWLEKGGIVKMAIQSPDGKEEIAVEGKVVWSEEQKRYGVAFSNANDSIMGVINRWTQSLLKT